MFSLENVPNIRRTKVYRQMDPFTACSVAEGFCGGEEADDQTKCAAWQYIYDTGLFRTLQGWYGRTVQDLLASGLINERRAA